MVRTRKSYGGEGLTQKELGARVGTSQNIISLIESGEVSSSQYILPISNVLGISPPQHHESERQRAWSELGHILEHKSTRKFERAMALVEAMVEDDEGGKDEDEGGPRDPNSRLARR